MSKAGTPSLDGLRVLNSRPYEQGLELNQQILNAGGHPVHIPALQIEATPPDWLEKLSGLPHIDQLIFISANAVRYFFSGLPPTHKARILHALSNATTTIGKTTAQELLQIGIPQPMIPGAQDSEHLLALPHLQEVNQQTILLVKGKGGRTLIASTLRQRGALITELEVYHRTCPNIEPKTTHALWKTDGIDIILFTSQEAMVNLFSFFDQKAHAWLRSKPCIVISPRLAKEAKILGMKHVLLSQPGHTIDALYQYTTSHDKD